MKVQTSLILFLFLPLTSCKSMIINSSTPTPIPSVTSSPFPVISTIAPTIIPHSLSTATPNEKDFANYYGVWTITHFEHLRLSVFLTDEYAESQIGKKMQLTHTEMHFDNDFLWLSTTYCSNASYNWATSDEFVGGGWQVLLPIDNPDKRNDLLYLDVKCEGNKVTGFEVSKTGKLVIFYDGYWFFLDSDRISASDLSIPSATPFNITFTPTPSPKVPFTITATLAPTEFYQEYFFDWLISKEADAHRHEIVQAGSHLLFTSEEHPNTPDSYTDIDLSLYTEGKNDFKLSLVKGNPVEYQLLPIHGTKIIPVDFLRARLETCINADYSSSLHFISLKAQQGNYFCVFTSDQRFSLVHIDQVNHLGDGSLRLSFVTYKKDTDK